MGDKSYIKKSIQPQKISGLHLLALVPKLLRNPLPALVKLNRRHGNILTFDGGKYQQLHVISDPKIVKHILKTNAENYQRSPVIKALKPLLGDGIFISEGEIWKHQHQMLKPALHDKHIEAYLKVVDMEVNSLLQALEKHSKLIEIELLIEEMMLKILVKSVFGFTGVVDLQRIISSHKDILNAVGIEKQKLDFFKKKIFGIKHTSGQKELENNVAYLHSVAELILVDMIKYASPLMHYLEKDHADKATQIDMILNLLFAGYDTTASALSMALYCLSKHPEWQQKIVDEHKLDQSESLKMVIQESMRLYPPVWSLLRLSKATDNIEGWEIPADSYFMINVNSLHRNADIWSHPDQFYPQHFTSDQMKGKAFSYIPFGQGQRMCIGKPLAMQELELIIPKLLNHSVFVADKPLGKEVRIRPDIIVKSRDGIRLKLRRRIYNE